MMKTSLIDQTGRRFGRLLVLSRAENSKPKSGGKGRVMWLAQCDCGRLSVVLSTSLVSGNTRSCGCLEQEARNAGNQTTHGAARRGSLTPEFKSWRAMRQRCYSTYNTRYPEYGGRGIVVCDRWKDDFSTFLADMGPKPSPKHSIDRIDTDGNYEPSNCRWATASEQARNKRNIPRLTMNGITLTPTEWGEKLGMDAARIASRVKRGWSHERALTEPLRIWPKKNDETE